MVAEGGDNYNPNQSSKEGVAFQYEDSDLNGRRTPRSVCVFGINRGRIVVG